MNIHMHQWNLLHMYALCCVLKVDMCECDCMWIVQTGRSIAIFQFHPHSPFENTNAHVCCLAVMQETDTNGNSTRAKLDH